MIGRLCLRALHRVRRYARVRERVFQKRENRAQHVDHRVIQLRHQCLRRVHHLHLPRTPGGGLETAAASFEIPCSTLFPFPQKYFFCSPIVSFHAKICALATSDFSDGACVVWLSVCVSQSRLTRVQLFYCPPPRCPRPYESAYEEGKSVAEVAQGGWGLAFVVYPTAMALFGPGAG